MTHSWPVGWGGSQTPITIPENERQRIKTMDLQDKTRFPLSTKDGHTPAMQARVDAFVLDELLEKRENGVQLSDYQLAYLAELLAKEKIREEQARNSGWDPDPHTDAFLAKEEAARKVEPTTTTTETEEDEEPSPWAMSPERAAAVAKAHREFFRNDPRGK
jgi:hypothetical protein